MENFVFSLQVCLRYPVRCDHAFVPLLWENFHSWFMGNKLECGTNKSPGSRDLFVSHSDSFPMTRLRSKHSFIDRYFQPIHFTLRLG